MRVFPAVSEYDVSEVDQYKISFLDETRKVVRLIYIGCRSMNIVLPYAVVKLGKSPTPVKPLEQEAEVRSIPQRGHLSQLITEIR